MSIQTDLWFCRVGGEISPLPFARPIEVSTKGEIRANARGEDPEPADVLMVRLDGGNGACAAVLVPSKHDRPVRLNRVGLPAGMHLLAHGDRLDAGGRIFWVSLRAVAEETVYDPGVHGEDCFCFRSKARLEAGDAIVICPGTPEMPCDMIFKASAWKRASASKAGVRCHNCRFDPSAPAWKPAAPKEGRSVLDELFERAGQ